MMVDKSDEEHCRSSVGPSTRIHATQQYRSMVTSPSRPARRRRRRRQPRVIRMLQVKPDKPPPPLALWPDRSVPPCASALLRWTSQSATAHSPQLDSQAGDTHARTHACTQTRRPCVDRRNRARPSEAPRCPFPRFGPATLGLGQSVRLGLLSSATRRSLSVPPARVPWRTWTCRFR